MVKVIIQARVDGDFNQADSSRDTDTIYWWTDCGGSENDVPFLSWATEQLCMGPGNDRQEFSIRWFSLSCLTKHPRGEDE